LFLARSLCKNLIAASNFIFPILNNNTTIRSSLNIIGNLIVTSTSLLQNNVSINSDLNISGNTLINNISISSNLIVSNNSIFNLMVSFFLTKV
jgi:bifunctional N-acetylglucosamine-1-phosphate-uridyltransferase/glucosamine-1-phosphate-acetyltransferase GlmU-like protein